jgi:ligand-binding SRPBCC domain-containing protein
MTVIEQATVINAPIQTVFRLSLSIDLELEASRPIGLAAVGGVTSGTIGLGQRVKWTAKQFGVTVPHESEIAALGRPTYFQDRMIAGLFQSFQHDHFFTALGEHQTEMRDVLQFRMPWWLMAAISERLVVRRRLNRLLQLRNGLIKEKAEVAIS